MDSKENKFSKISKPSGWGARHTLAFFGFIGFALSYAMRFNLAIAIVAMVNSTRSTPSGDSTAFPEEKCPHNVQEFSPMYVEETSVLISSTATATVPVNASLDLQDVQDETWVSAGEFNWDEEEQGFILGCFFIGYLATQIPGGFLGRKFGGKWPLGLGLLTTAIVALLTPTAARLGKGPLVAVRIVQGLGEGVTMPAMHAMLAKWAPVDERSKMSAAVYAGMYLGTSATMFISGYIIHYFGWPTVFYASGGCTILWFVLWATVIADTPAKHPRISADELEYITASLMSSSSSGSKTGTQPIPWRSVLTSRPFWAILLCQMMETWGLYTLLHEIPTYMQNVLHFEMKENSVLSALPHLLAWANAICITQICDRLIERKMASVLTVRKLCNSFGLWGAAAGMVGVACSGCNRTAASVFLVLAVGSYGCLLGGVIANLIDIAPNYASVLMGIVNTFATLSGFGAPWLAGYILRGDPSLENWRIVFLLAASICMFSNMIYVLMASGKEQEWNRGAPAPKEEPQPVAFAWGGQPSNNMEDRQNQINIQFGRASQIGAEPLHCYSVESTAVVLLGVTHYCTYRDDLTQL